MSEAAYNDHGEHRTKQENRRNTEYRSARKEAQLAKVSFEQPVSNALTVCREEPRVGMLAYTLSKGVTG